MAIGKRIQQRLNEMGWQRSDLLSAIPELSAQALSNLIRRDSKRSEWDQAIAKALKTSVLWLVYGEPTEFTGNVAPLPKPVDPLVNELLDHAGRISPVGLARLVERAAILAEQYPKVKANHVN